MKRNEMKSTLLALSGNFPTANGVMHEKDRDYKKSKENRKVIVTHLVSSLSFKGSRWLISPEKCWW